MFLPEPGTPEEELVFVYLCYKILEIFPALYCRQGSVFSLALRILGSDAS